MRESLTLSAKEQQRSGVVSRWLAGTPGCRDARRGYDAPVDEVAESCTAPAGDGQSLLAAWDASVRHKAELVDRPVRARCRAGWRRSSRGGAGTAFDRPGEDPHA